MLCMWIQRLSLAVIDNRIPDPMMSLSDALLMKVVPRWIDVDNTSLYTEKLMRRNFENSSHRVLILLLLLSRIWN